MDYQKLQKRINIVESNRHVTSHHLWLLFKAIDKDITPMVDEFSHNGLIDARKLFRVIVGQIPRYKEDDRTINKKLNRLLPDGKGGGDRFLHELFVYTLGVYARLCHGLTQEEAILFTNQLEEYATPED